MESFGGASGYNNNIFVGQLNVSSKSHDLSSQFVKDKSKKSFKGKRNTSSYIQSKPQSKDVRSNFTDYIGDKFLNHKHAEDLLCNVKYTTSLPKIPVDSKFIKFEKNLPQFYQYKPSLLHNNQSCLLSHSNLNIPINLLEHWVYKNSPEISIPSDDEVLLHDEYYQDKEADSAKKKEMPTWLRAPIYMSYDNQKYGNALLNERDFMSSKESSREDGSLSFDRTFQLKQIQESFQVLYNRPLSEYTHPNNPMLKAIESYPFFPDFENFVNSFAYIIFNSDPKPKINNSSEVEVLRLKLKHAFLYSERDRGLETESYYSYYLPDLETLEALQLLSNTDNSKERCYIFHRDYSVVSSDRDKYVLLCKRKEAAYYSDVSQVMKIRIRRSRTSEDGEDFVRPTTAVVTKRKFSQKERRERRKRQKVIGEKVSDDSSTEEETEKHAADSYNIDNDFEDELWSSDDSPKCLPELGGLDKGGNLQGTEK